MKRVKTAFAAGILPSLVLLSASICLADSGADPQQPREIKVIARKFEFVPKTINVKKGEHIRLVVTSEDVDHGIAIKEFGIDQEIKAKTTKTVEFTANKEGRFEFACSVFCGDGHPDMVGEVVVSGAQTAGSNMKVTFDENAPGVVFVESGGERVRIDTSARTFARVESAPAQQPTITAEPPKVAKERESSKASEPYDYHVINVPTPKRVREHSLNLYFTHRFQEPLRTPDVQQDLFGLDSFSVSSFGFTYGITDRLYANVYRSPLCQTGLCKTIELGLGYHWLDEEAGKSPIALSTYASVEGDYNFTERYTVNIQGMIGRSITKYVNAFFSPAVHINSNGSGRFNPNPNDFFPPAPAAAALRLGQNTGSFGFGLNARIRPTVSLLFDYTPRVGFKMGQVTPLFDPQHPGTIIGFKNNSEAALGFGIEKRIGRHVFSLTFSNTQTTTTARYNSSNNALPPSYFSMGFNLYRRLL
jgi:cytochrome c oxidase subunit II